MTRSDAKRIENSRGAGFSLKPQEPKRPARMKAQNAPYRPTQERQVDPPRQYDDVEDLYAGDRHPTGSRKVSDAPTPQPDDDMADNEDDGMDYMEPWPWSG